MSRVQVTHGPYEHEAGSVLTLWEVCSVIVEVRCDGVVGIFLIRLVSRGVQRVLYVLSVAGYHLVVGVGNTYGVGVFGELRYEQVAIILRHFIVFHTSIEQEQVVVEFSLRVRLWEVLQQS